MVLPFRYRLAQVVREEAVNSVFFSFPELLSPFHTKGGHFINMLLNWQGCQSQSLITDFFFMANSRHLYKYAAKQRTLA